ncbi:MAG TPA: chromate resistance protein ChrB domain-containing protein [Gemmatimonadales bacterium]|nr:chromate resistance protein ChrB domain-containing protein [Gemmatimonadales bacterium]
MLWVTRPHCHVDRTACAWAIRKFVDPEAAFAFAPDLAGAKRLGGTPFDMRGAELGHSQGRCSFESLLLKYRLDDPALRELAEVIHEADVDDDRFHTPEAAGLDAIIRGVGMLIEDDRELFAVTDRVFEGLYAWFKRSGA